MTKNPQRLSDYLEHILRAIEKIHRYTESDKDEFMRNELVQDAVIRNLEIVGEASRNIERDFPEFVTEHPELPLVFAYEMRNVLSHSYF
ncbi:MAG: HepT-like ribonuclease domain-containing protein [Granulosicoccus sp.]